jgi:hypothetical protein
MTSSLTPAERRERQRTDHLLIAALDGSDAPVHASGHASAEDVRANQNPIPVGDRTPPSHYRVVYDLDTLSGPGVRHRPTIVHVAPLANGDYPAAPPSAWVISDVIPWTPHFAANVPVCHGGSVWLPNRTQLVDYVIHIGKLLNFDEPPPIPGYHGYNGAAVEYWRSTMNLQPLDPSLRFPQILLEDYVRRDGFRKRSPASSPSPDRFSRATPGGRQPEAAPEPTGAVRFRPAVQRDTRRFGPAGSRS